MILDTVANWKCYDLGKAWETAFEYLTTLHEGAEEGLVPLAGDDMSARVMDYAKIEETDPDAILEAHRKFADIHMTLSGWERIARYDTASLAVKTEYGAERDVEFYSYEGPAPIQLSLEPGLFALLLPQDAHMPKLHTGTVGEMVKKVVVKIPLDALNFNQH